MKPATLAIAAALAFIVYKRRQAANAPKQATIGPLKEGQIMDGTNWTAASMWDRLETASDFKDPYNPNLAGATLADPGKVGQAQLGLMPGWNGNL